MLKEVLGVGEDPSFGIDEDAFKTRDEKRLAEQVRIREAQSQTAQFVKRLEVKDERADDFFEERALEVVGRPRLVLGPTGDVRPSEEASGLKAKELRP